MRPRGRFKCKNNALGIYYKNNFDHLLNIRPPHFASKVSYSASPQTSATCPRIAPCSGRSEKRGTVAGDKGELSPAATSVY